MLYHKVIITDDRLNESVTRILAKKAALKLHVKLHEKKDSDTLVPGAEAHSIFRNEGHIKGY